MVNPDIFLIGAAKAGTTSIANWMNENPGIALSRIKEPNYFSKEIDEKKFSLGFKSMLKSLPIGYWTQGDLEFIHQGFIKDAKHYKRLFEHASEGQKLAECSTSYLWSTKAPAEVKRASPNAKVSIVIRNPVDRAWSHYRMARKYGLVSGTFLQELEKDFLAVSVWGKSENFYHLSCYSKSIERWMEFFGSNQLKIEIYEIFFSEPQTSWDKICQFWKVETSILPTMLKAHEGQDPKFPRINQFIFRSNLIFFKTFFSKKLIARAKNYLFKRDPDILSPAIREKAMNYFLDDIRELETLLGRSLSLWN